MKHTLPEDHNPRAPIRQPDNDSDFSSDWACPECGARVDAHDGWGGPGNCSLTDNGAAQRAYALRKKPRPEPGCRC